MELGLLTPTTELLKDRFVRKSSLLEFDIAKVRYFLMLRYADRTQLDLDYGCKPMSHGSLSF